VSSRLPKAASLLLAALLTACATRPAAPDYLNGRLALRVEAHEGQASRSFAAPFELQGDANAGQFSLLTPLGTTAARAAWRPGQALLSNEAGQTSYPDLDSLAADMLGQALPMAALLDWLRGRPWPGAPHHPTDAGFEQLGWQINTRAKSDGHIEARRDTPPVVTVRIRLESSPP
jgi:outer membrane lipoprotein LolB